jgi:hypothetical protein
MSDLMKFMMTVIALALLMFLNSGILTEKRGEMRRGMVIIPEKKLPV